uniref:(northern house mosquito) hypothetical protein n=1 Tax=Culex pipiens TaxID=7175 RepID=A0A8D8L2Y2_CULPI
MNLSLYASSSGSRNFLYLCFRWNFFFFLKRASGLVSSSLSSSSREAEMSLSITYFQKYSSISVPRAARANAPEMLSSFSSAAFTTVPDRRTCKAVCSSPSSL